MKILIESTETFAKVRGTAARLWEGKTEGGIPIVAYVSLIRASVDEDCAAFEAELREVPPPINEWPLANNSHLLIED